MLTINEGIKKIINKRAKYEVVCDICNSINYMEKSQFKALKDKTICGQRCSIITRLEAIKYIEDIYLKTKKEAEDIYEVFRMRYNALNQRCNDINADNYRWYGEKGIMNEYVSLSDFTNKQFKNFINGYMIHGDKISPDRINNDENYNCKNIRWIHFSEQHSNKTIIYKTFKAISPSGEIYYSDNKTQFAKQYGLTRQSIVACLSGKDKSHYGWKFEKVNC